jgi:hypothetical protein
VLGLIRILVGLTLLYDFVHIWHLDLVEPLFAPNTQGGISNVMDRPGLPLIFKIFPASVATATWMHGLICLSAFFFTIGLFTRSSGVVLLMLYAQSALIVPLGDRGIDMMMRNVVFLLIFSSCGAWGSVDAKRQTGRWLGSGADVPAWPRHLLILQVIVMYFAAGVQKVGMDWMPMGGFAGLYVILQDPAVARADYAWLADWYPITQLATALTMLFEWLSPLVLLTYHFRATPERTGRMRRFYGKWKPHLWWIALGVMLHLGIAMTLALGIFPYAMLALYPAFLHPDELLSAFGRARNWRRKQI